MTGDIGQKDVVDQSKLVFKLSLFQCHVDVLKIVEFGSTKRGEKLFHS